MCGAAFVVALLLMSPTMISAQAVSPASPTTVSLAGSEKCDVTGENAPDNENEIVQHWQKYVACARDGSYALYGRCRVIPTSWFKADEPKPSDGFTAINCGVMAKNVNLPRILIRFEDFALINPQGKRIPVNEPLTATGTPEYRLVEGPLPPGEFASGWIKFSVPKDTSAPLWLEWQPEERLADPPLRIEIPLLIVLPGTS